MCCSFNKKAADEIFTKSAYANLVSQKQKENKQFSFNDFTKPQWYIKDDLKAMPGIDKGLTFMIDAHNDLVGGAAVGWDYQSFVAVVSEKGSYPLTHQDGIQIKPGHYNFVALSATKISSDDAIRDLSPDDRKCKFNDEIDDLKIHSKYSLSNCLLECSLTYALEQMNHSQLCTPWFLPSLSNPGTICDPWQAAEFDEHFKNVIESTCNQCLPDCDAVHYDASVTAVPFRKCDYRNLEVSPLCSIKDPLPPKPQIWSKEYLEELFKLLGPNSSVPTNTGIASSLRTYGIQLTQPGIFNFANETYDAYDKDIAVVEFYFKKSSVVEFKTNVSMTWIDFFAAVGGLLGLCIGLSIVTLVELFWLALRLVTNAVEPK